MAHTYGWPIRIFVIHEALHRSTALPKALYFAAFAMQLAGGVIVFLEIRDDLRAAKRIPSRGITWETAETAPEVLKTRLSAKGWRIAGVALIFLGAVVGLAANLLAL
jgi:hypothetical protein